MTMTNSKTRTNKLLVILAALCFGLWLDGRVPTVEDSVSRTTDSVVLVAREGSSGHGSGVAVSPDTVITAEHVVRGKTGPLYVRTNSGKRIMVKEFVPSLVHDLAVLKLEVPGLKPAKIGSFHDCRLGQTLYSIGSTRGRHMFNAVAVGNLQKMSVDLEHWGWGTLFALTAEGGPGNSGGPVFSLDGKLRGIWVGSRQPNIHYAIPIDVVMGELRIVDLLLTMSKWKIGSVSQNRAAYQGGGEPGPFFGLPGDPVYRVPGQDREIRTETW